MRDIKISTKRKGWAWWYISIIPALGRLKQGYVVETLSQNNNKTIYTKR
jgi:hypothetical protein